MSDVISLERKLRALRAIVAPRDLASNVLVLSGLADRFAIIATPLGKMYIAWNEAGVSLVRPAKTAKAFSHLLDEQLGHRGVASPMPNDLQRALERRFAGEVHVKIAVDLRSRSAFVSVHSAGFVTALPIR